MACKVLDMWTWHEYSKLLIIEYGIKQGNIFTNFKIQRVGTTKTNCLCDKVGEILLVDSFVIYLTVF